MEIVGVQFSWWNLRGPEFDPQLPRTLSVVVVKPGVPVPRTLSVVVGMPESQCHAH